MNLLRWYGTIFPVEALETPTISGEMDSLRALWNLEIQNAGGIIVKRKRPSNTPVR